VTRCKNVKVISVSQKYKIIPLYNWVHKHSTTFLCYNIKISANLQKIGVNVMVFRSNTSLLIKYTIISQ